MLKQFLNYLMGTIEEHDEEGVSKYIVTRSTDACDPMISLTSWAKKIQKADPLREVANERRLHGERLKQEWRERWSEHSGSLLSLPGTQLTLRLRQPASTAPEVQPATLLAPLPAALPAELAALPPATVKHTTPKRKRRNNGNSASHSSESSVLYAR